MDRDRSADTKHLNRKDKIVIWSLLMAVAIFAILMAWPSLYNVLHQFDIKALKSVNSNRFESLDPFFLLITNTSSMLCVIITCLILLAGSLMKKRALVLKGWQLLVTFLTSFVFIKTLKYLIGRDRPFITYDFLDKLAHAESMSFPSGHTFEAFAFATAVVLQFKNPWLKYVIFLWAVLVGLSRMVLGMHYLSDVLGGLIFGILSGYFVHVLYRKNIMAAKVNTSSD